MGAIAVVKPNLALPGAHRRCPCLYIARRGSDVLYVGHSTRGLQRPLGSDHEKLARLEPEDVIEVYFRPESAREDLLSEEAQLIRTLRPLWNCYLQEEDQDVVRTSLILPHDVWAQAKALGAVERKDLRDLIVEGLKLVIASRKGR